MIEFDESDDRPAGIPAWMATFADLMSLLMCFFVLLLSFSEMDIIKYKQIAGSMREAFGVQNKINAKDIPKGTSVIAKEFSPGKTQPIPSKNINQETTDVTKHSLRVGSSSSYEDMKDLSPQEREKLLEKALQELLSQTQSDAEKLREAMKDNIADGKIDIQVKGRIITIRISEKGSFPSASATLNDYFIPVIHKLQKALATVEGTISVEGHTDNVPITSSIFESNWDLSVSRALSVTRELLFDSTLDNKRFVVVGHADTKPIDSNDTKEGKANNRRVEIVIKQGLEDSESSILEIL